MGRKRTSWSSIRKISQGFFLVCWIVLFISTVGLAWPAHLVHIPAQLDPLLMVAQAIASRALVGGILFSLITILLTFVFGRSWCGWICPVGTTLDIFHLSQKHTKKTTIPDGWRRVKYVLLAAILMAALFGNLTLLVFDPITLWVRTLAGGIWPALNTAFSATEMFLANFSWLDTPLQWVDQLLRPAVFPAEDVGIRYTWLPVSIFAGIILLNLVAERFWCRYLCPLGGLLGWISRFALVKRTVETGCKSCGTVQQVLPDWNN